MSNDATFLRMPAVEARVGLKRPTIYALAAKNLFPKPCKIGPRASAWVLAEILDWEAARIKESRGATCAAGPLGLEKPLLPSGGPIAADLLPRLPAPPEAA